MSTRTATPPPVGRPDAAGLWASTRSTIGPIASGCLLLLLLALGLASCGGGVGTGGTGSFAQGTITGFGSIIVNDVRFDESAARVEDDDGAAQSASMLALGMQVQVQAGPLATTGAVTSAAATLVRVNRALVGPASAVDAVAGRFTVLGQGVSVDADTVIDDRLVNGLAGLAQAGQIEVYGSFDVGSGRIAATRVGPAPAGAPSQVSGAASQVDGVARTLRIGSQTYSFAALGGLPGLAEGATIKLKLQGGMNGQGHWLVSAPGATVLTPTESVQLELRGLVQALSSASRFTVDGTPVDAGTAQVEGTVALGASVRVSGALRAGVLVASRVKVDNKGKPQTFELKGPITSLDKVNRRLVVRQTTIGYARPDLQYSGGTEAQLAVGRKIEVEGQLSANGLVLEALKIKFDD